MTAFAQLAAPPHGAVLAAEDLSMFGNDPWWLVVIKAVFCFAFLMVTVLFSIVCHNFCITHRPRNYPNARSFLPYRRPGKAACTNSQ